MFCSNCGNPLAENANFCNKCGLKTARNEPVRPGYQADNPVSSPVVQQVKSRSNGFSVFISLFCFALIAVVLFVMLFKPAPRWDLCDCFNTSKLLFDKNGKPITSIREAAKLKKERDEGCKWIEEEMTPDDAWLRFSQCK